jgi:hypothetical protein
MRIISCGGAHKMTARAGAIQSDPGRFNHESSENYFMLYFNMLSMLSRVITRGAADRMPGQAG